MTVRMLLGLGLAIAACKDRSASAPATEPTEPLPTAVGSSEHVHPQRPVEPIRDLDDDVYEDMIPIPEGWLQLPPTKAWIYSFYIDRTEVTVGQYRECVSLGGCRPPQPYPPDRYGEPDCANYLEAWSERSREDHPMTCIDATDAYAYCLQARKRLPTESEWMRAARNDDTRLFPWGDKKPTCKELAFKGYERTRCSNPSTRPVGTSKLDTSPFGVLDLAGNVSEFVIARGMRNLPLVHGEKWDTKGGGTNTPNDLEIDSPRFASGAHPGVGFRCAAGGKPL